MLVKLTTGISKEHKKSRFPLKPYHTLSHSHVRFKHIHQFKKENFSCISKVREFFQKHVDTHYATLRTHPHDLWPP